ncbi:hypothetical protein I532_04255 [Brevibacillus borstelensis AK1]|uniref:Uncharacterized protein n=1 Tax=Brevibacillus borstelensis AK1 TaxID=1300222 RepID=M8DEL3_9BACL|nr:hypothetical protein I532_04255 [Brevibacillus borstelensis AK1]
MGGGEESGRIAGAWVLEDEIVGGGFRIIQSCGGLERLGVSGGEVFFAGVGEVGSLSAPWFGWRVGFDLAAEDCRNFVTL